MRYPLYYSSIILVVLPSLTKGEFCIKLNDGSCVEDCECCGYKAEGDIRCELRNSATGRKCYQSKDIGSPCNTDSECKSQHCVGGICSISALKKRRIQSECPLKFEYGTIAISGKLAEFPEECIHECAVTGASTEAKLATDNNLDTVYVNHLPIGSGIKLFPSDNAPLTQLRICNADGCPECDPTCFKLKGLCEFSDTVEEILSGELDFKSRKECITIRVPHRKLFKEYELTFPCQRASAPTCPTSCDCHNGLTPFEPDPVIPTSTCNNDTPISEGPELEFYSMKKVGDVTEIVYKLDNPGGRNDQYQFDYAVLPWKGDCCFDCFVAWLETNDPQDDPLGIPCHATCSSVNELEGHLNEGEKDEFLCMEGLKLYNPEVIGSQTYYFQVFVHGDVTLAPQTYGIKLKTGRRGSHFGISYKSIDSPVCPSANCQGGECKSFPMRISDVAMFGKCPEFTIEKPIVVPQ